GHTIPAHRPRVGLYSFRTAFPRLGPSHRVPSIVECKELIRVQTFVAQLQELSATALPKTVPYHRLGPLPAYLCTPQIACFAPTYLRLRLLDAARTVCVRTAG